VQEGATEEGEGGFLPVRQEVARRSELWCNSGSHPSPPATKGQVEGEGAAGAAIEGKWSEGKALTGDSGGALLQMKN
jgi:hypothetical protein